MKVNYYWKLYSVNSFQKATQKEKYTYFQIPFIQHKIYSITIASKILIWYKVGNMCIASFIQISFPNSNDVFKC